MMEWIEINPNKLPEGEVLAGNFKPRTYGYKEKIIGYLENIGDQVTCESEHEYLGNCTHYIDINQHDPPPCS